MPRRVYASAGWLIGGRLVGSACTFVTLYVLAQTLDGDGFGRLTFWISAFLVLDGIVDFGTGATALQRISAQPGETAAVLRTARRARAAMALIVVAGVAATGLALEGSDAPFLMVAALYQLSHVLELSTLGWRDRIAWRSPVLVRAGAATCSLAAVLLVLASGERRPLAFLVAIAFGSTLGNFALHHFGRRGLPSTHGVTPAPLGPFLVASIPMGAAAVCQQLYFHVDNVFVRTECGDTAVGHYGVAVRIMSLAIMGGVFAASAAQPWLTRAHMERQLLRATLRLTLVTGLLGAAIASVGWALRAQLLGVFGDEFREASPALAWLFGAGFAVHLGAPLLTAVVAAGRGRSVLVAAATGLLLNVAGNAWLVPEHGMRGAAITTFATELWIVVAALGALLRAQALGPPQLETS
ncbi:MAG: oligosaccharide flippase family protein [Planctomycetota bacterium]